MRLTITLDRGDAALGTIDMEELEARLTAAVEDAYAETVYQQMPATYTTEGCREFGWREGGGPRDFETSAVATIRWMLRHYVIGPRRNLDGAIPAAEDLCPTATVDWPSSPGAE